MALDGKSILGTLDLTVDQVAVLAAALNTAQTIGIFFAYWIVQAFGRRTILIWGSVFQLVALIIFTVLGSESKVPRYMAVSFPLEEPR
jgi:Na+/melibiose symporter-like transporter